MWQTKEPPLEFPSLLPPRKRDAEIGGWQETGDFLRRAEPLQFKWETAGEKSLLLPLFIQQLEDLLVSVLANPTIYNKKALKWMVVVNSCSSICAWVNVPLSHERFIEYVLWTADQSVWGTKSKQMWSLYPGTIWVVSYFETMFSGKTFLSVWAEFQSLPWMAEALKYRI